jgi:hypothetical protein
LIELTCSRHWRHLIYVAIIGTGLALYHYAKRLRHVYTEHDPYDAETEPFD